VDAARAVVNGSAGIKVHSLARSYGALRRAGFRLRRLTKPLGIAASSHESGQALVEAALAIPIVAAFMFSMIELCLVFYSYCLTSELAREGSRYAIVHGATCLTASNASCTASSTGVNTFVSQLGWPNLGSGTITPSTSYPDGNENPGNRAQVQVTYSFPVTLPFVPKETLTMSSKSVMYIIQ
jgi:Flp pilus assembly protein TadG